MKNLKIGRKFLFTFGLILAFFVATVGLSIASLNSVSSNFTEFYQEQYQIVKKTEQMSRQIEAASKFVGYATMTSSLEETAGYIDSAQEQLDSFKEGIAFLKENFDGEKSYIDNVNTAMLDSVALKEDVFSHAKSLENEEAIKVFFNEYRPYLLTADENLAKINTAAADNAQQLFNEAESAKKATMIILVLVSGATLAVTILLAMYLTRSMTRPIEEIKNAAHQIEEGDLNAVISYESQDELGVLAATMGSLINKLKTIIGDINVLLGEMAQGNFRVRTKCESCYVGDYEDILKAMRNINRNLSDTLSQINEASNQVAVGSEQVSDASQALMDVVDNAAKVATVVESIAAASEGQSASITQINQGVEQISAVVQNNSATAEESAATSEELSGQAHNLKDLISRFKLRD